MWLRPVVLLVVLVATGLVRPSAPADAASTDWRGALAERIDARPVVTAAELKRRLPGALAGKEQPPLAHADIQAVGGDGADRYADGDRPFDSDTAALVFGHDRTLATGLQAL